MQGLRQGTDPGELTAVADRDDLDGHMVCAGLEMVLDPGDRGVGRSDRDDGVHEPVAAVAFEVVRVEALAEEAPPVVLQLEIDAKVAPGGVAGRDEIGRDRDGLLGSAGPCGCARG